MACNNFIEVFHCRQISKKTQQSKAMQEPMKLESDKYPLHKQN